MSVEEELQIYRAVNTRIEHLEILREHLDFEIYSAQNRLEEVTKEIEELKKKLKGETDGIPKD